MAISLFTTSAYAQLQEVRGIETRRVIYYGPQYETGYAGEKYSNRYYGYEFTNANSISVSVDIVIYKRWNSTNREAVYRKTITLKPKESYILKYDGYKGFMVDKNCMDDISNYDIEYKAYKLL